MTQNCKSIAATTTQTRLPWCPQGSISHDKKGNQTRRADRSEVVYTPFNLPSQVQTVDGVTTQFLYDAFEQRVFKRSARGETTYVLGLYEKRQDNDGNVSHVMPVFNNERQVAQVTLADVPDAPGSYAETTSYLHVDSLGSVDTITDAQGHVVERMKFDPFGNRLDASALPMLTVGGAPQTNVNVGFTAHENDDELGLVNMRGRMYDPQTGRFMTPDPIVSVPLFGQGLNRYSYVLNNPMTLTDPSGFAPEGGGFPSISASIGAAPAMRQEIETGDQGADLGPQAGQSQGTSVGATTTQVTDDNGSRQAQSPMAGSQVARFAQDATMYLSGIGVGYAAGALPMGGAAASAAGIPDNKGWPFRLGFGVGEVWGGINTVATGISIAGLGAAGTVGTAGVGAGVGAVAVVGGAVFVTAGAVNVWAGLKNIVGALMMAGHTQTIEGTGTSTGGLQQSGESTSGAASAGDGEGSAKGSAAKEAAALIEDYLGPGARATRNEAGDLVVESANAERKVRFDLSKPAPHKNPHAHVEEFMKVKNKSVPTFKSGPIYPKGVPNE